MDSPDEQLFSEVVASYSEPHRYYHHAAVSAATTTGLSSAVIERVQELILATKHKSAPATHDAALLVDVDLAILGAPVERFDEYERQVRKEYGWAPG